MAATSENGGQANPKVELCGRVIGRDRESRCIREAEHRGECVHDLMAALERSLSRVDRSPRR